MHVIRSAVTSTSNMLAANILPISSVKDIFGKFVSNRENQSSHMPGYSRESDHILVSMEQIPMPVSVR